MKHPAGAIGAAIIAGAGDPVMGVAGDLDKDGTIEGVAITQRTKTRTGQPMGGEIVVSRWRERHPRAVWRQRNLNPWKLQLADVDGDKRPEVVVGVYKKSPRDPVMAKRVFVYSWNGKRLMPKWLGSRLSRRFDDFALADLDNDGWAELAALEAAPKGKHRLALYKWRSFGFDWLGCSKDIEAKSISPVSGNVIMVGRADGPGRAQYRNGKITFR